jgi:hypothetical protein
MAPHRRIGNDPPVPVLDSYLGMSGDFIAGHLPPCPLLGHCFGLIRLCRQTWQITDQLAKVRERRIAHDKICCRRHLLTPILFRLS